MNPRNEYYVNRYLSPEKAAEIRALKAREHGYRTFLAFWLGVSICGGVINGLLQLLGM